MPRFPPTPVLAAVAAAAALAACGHNRRPPVTAPAPTAATTELTPGRDLAGAAVTATRPGGEPGQPDGGRPGTGDGRPHYDLDEIRLTVTGHDVTGDPRIDAVASSQLLDQAKAALDDGHPHDAIVLYRRLAEDFPDSALAPAALFNVGVVLENLGDVVAAIGAYRELVARFPRGRESLDGHLRAAGLQAERNNWVDAERTLREIEARDDVSYLDRIEVQARLGYVLLESGHPEQARTALEGAVAAWRKATHVEDAYFIAMAYYYLGELAHREFAAVPLRSADTLLKGDLVAKERLAAEAYDRWKQALEQKDAYWSLAAGYRMSQTFYDLWLMAVRAPYPDGLDPAARPYYVVEVHDRVRRHLFTALDGHHMNVKLAAAYGVDNAWSRASAVKAGEITAILARESRGETVVPPAGPAPAPTATAATSATPAAP